MEFHCYDCANDLLAPWIKHSFPENQIPKELVYFFFFVLCTKQAEHLIYRIKMKTIFLSFTLMFPKVGKHFFLLLSSAIQLLERMLQLGERSGVAKDNKITCHSTKSKLAFQFISKWPDVLSWALCQEKVLAPPLRLYYKDTCRGSYRYLWCLGPWFRLPSHREMYYIFSKTDRSSVTATHTGKYR